MTLGYPSRAFLDGAEDAPYRDPATGELLQMVEQVADGCGDCGGERYPEGRNSTRGPTRLYCPGCMTLRYGLARAARRAR